MAMATLVSTTTTSFSTSTRARSLLHPCSSISCCKAPNFGISTWVPQLGSGNLSQWSGLKQLSISITPKSLHKERKRRCNGSRVVRASLFGVGAPEALVIGVVALLVFGPKGLAEVARNLGKTLRAFQPTIRELQEVSREFKSTLEKEIGLDEITNVTQTTNFSNRTPSAPPAASSPSSSVTSTADSPAQAEPNGTPAPNNAYTSDELLEVTEEQLKASASQQQSEMPVLDNQPEAKVAEEQPEASVAQQQMPTPDMADSQVEEAQAQPTVKDAAAALSPGSAKSESET
ncbi:unnamed protein product [Linum tenue]|uniref:Uncharacterized protein n=1 Tax=Linum tenue TaxID=586396 RepID=A0AAV0J2J3_9ROSI|nr:unnamed protein product [Linum tenue]